MLNGPSSHPLRVLAVGSMYPPHHMGGYEVVWQGAMRAASARGHRIRVLASDHRSGDAHEEDSDVHRTLRWYWSWNAYAFERLSPLGRLRLERHNRAELGRHIGEWRPDVACFWPMGGMSLSLIPQLARAGIPCLLVVHDDWLVYGPRVDAWIRLWSGRGRAFAGAVERLTGIPTRFDARVARGVLFNSRYMLSRALSQGVVTQAAAVVTPGVDERFEDPADLHPWSWRLLYLGRIDRQKGVDTAITALPHLPPQATLTIAGTGDHEYERELRSQVERLGLEGRVRFAGAVDREALGEQYAAHDVLVFPVRWDEPWGLVPLEAMAAGTPVVATARGGSREFLEDDVNALLFEADDAPGLASHVRRLAGDESLRARMRENGLATATKHSATEFERQIVDELEALFPSAAR